jgi:hypothetical protein
MFCVSETFIEMRDREMILVDETNESQKVQTVKEILINMGVFLIFLSQ